MTIPNLNELAAAAPGTVEAGAFVSKFNDVILFPLIMLMTGVAMLYFIYGCVIYIANAENSESRATGRSHIIYSIVGMFVMLSAYGLLMIVANTFGLKDNLDCANNPAGQGCDIIFLPNATDNTSNGSGGIIGNGSGDSKGNGTGKSVSN